MNEFTRIIKQIMDRLWTQAKGHPLATTVVVGTLGIVGYYFGGILLATTTKKAKAILADVVSIPSDVFNWLVNHKGLAAVLAIAFGGFVTFKVTSTNMSTLRELAAKMLPWLKTKDGNIDNLWQSLEQDRIDIDALEVRKLIDDIEMVDSVKRMPNFAQSATFEKLRSAALAGNVRAQQRLAVFFDSSEVYEDTANVVASAKLIRNYRS